VLESRERRESLREEDVLSLRLKTATEYIAPILKIESRATSREVEIAPITALIKIIETMVRK